MRTRAERRGEIVGVNQHVKLFVSRQIFGRNNFVALAAKILRKPLFADLRSAVEVVNFFGGGCLIFEREISHAVNGIAIFGSEAAFKGAVGHDDVFKLHGVINRLQTLNVDFQNLKQPPKIFLMFKRDNPPPTASKRSNNS